MSAILGASIGAATTIGGNAMANLSNRNLSRRQRAWNENMWNNQNEFNLEQWNRQEQRNTSIYERGKQDNLDFWHMQNEYNSPQAQMARFKEAGLNPNLIYGQGTSGTAGNIDVPNSANAETVKTSDVQGYNRPQMESVTRGLDVYGDTQRFKQLQAQTDNLKAQLNVTNQEALLKAQQTASTALQVKRGTFGHGVDKELRETSIEAATLNLEQQKQNIRRGDQQITQGDIKTSRDRLELQVQKDLRNPRIQQAYANIQKTLADTTGRNLSNALDRERLKLRKLGIEDGDNIIFRALAKNWDSLKKGVKAELQPIFNSMPTWYKKILVPWKY